MACIGWSRHHARIFCKGDYDDGGQYCSALAAAGRPPGWGTDSEKVIAPLGVAPVCDAWRTELPAAPLYLRRCPSNLEQLRNEAKKPSNRNDAMLRNRLASQLGEWRLIKKLEKSRHQATAFQSGCPTLFVIT